MYFLVTVYILKKCDYAQLILFIYYIIRLTLQYILYFVHKFILFFY